MADIVVKDRNGNPAIHKGVTALEFHTVDGGIHSFGSAGWTAETLKMNGANKIIPTGSQMTISHGLGVVPDLIFIGRQDVDDIVDRNSGHIAWALGWSRRMMELENFSGYGALNTVCIDEPDGDGNVNCGTYGMSYGIDETHPYSYGEIREANSTSFTVGIDDTNNVSAGLHTRATYYWFAISGLGIRMNETSEV